MPALQPLAVTIKPWLRAQLGKSCFAGLCSGELDALCAAIHVIGIYAYRPLPSLLEAFAHVVLTMQEHNRFLAYHAIAHVMDWPDRARLWHLAGLPDCGPGQCIDERGPLRLTEVTP